MPRRPSPQTLRVLGALAARSPGWGHGYELAQELGLASGSLYPILARLADLRLVEASWDVGGQRRPRHLYRITGDGTAYLAAHGAVDDVAPARSRRLRAREVVG